MVPDPLSWNGAPRGWLAVSLAAFSGLVLYSRLRQSRVSNLDQPTSAPYWCLWSGVALLVGVAVLWGGHPAQRWLMALACGVLTWGLIQLYSTTESKARSGLFTFVGAMVGAGVGLLGPSGPSAWMLLLAAVVTLSPLFGSVLEALQETPSLRAERTKRASDLPMESTA